MIITKLNGGLGNQLFQYALGKNLANLNKTILKLDINRYQRKNSLRQYKLDNFNIIENFATNKEIRKTKKFSSIPFLSKHRKEKGRNFDNSILSTKDNSYLEGYWQSRKYFSSQGGSILDGKDIENIIRKEFTLKNQPSESLNKLNKKISEFGDNSVALHIRHGDYSNNPKAGRRHTVLPLKYYKKALEVISNKILDPYFFVFSDDIEWCKENFKKIENNYFVDDKNLQDYEALIAISKCKHQIIANSSFSWWGAWLNQNPNKIVITPDQWYNNLKVNMDDRLPKNWIKVNF